jgi:hypothetical protein
LPVLRLPSSARSAYLSGATAADAFSTDGLSVNPSAGSGMQGTAFQFSHGFWIDTFSYEDLSASIPLKKGRLHFAVRHFYTEPFQWTDANGDDAGTLNASDSLLSGGYIGAAGRLRYGAAVKALYSRLQDYGGFSACADAGASLVFGSLEKPFSLFLSVRNLGVPISYVAGSSLLLPLDVNTGLSWTAINDTVQKWSLSFSGLASVIPVSGRANIAIASELGLDRYLRVGLGYRFLADTARVSFGGGLLIPVRSSRIEIDLACLPDKTVNNVYILSAGYRFGQPSQPAPAVSPEATETRPVPAEPARAPTPPEAAPIVVKSTNTTNTAVAPAEFRFLIADFEYLRTSVDEENSFLTLLKSSLPNRTGLSVMTRKDLASGKAPVFDPSFCRNANCAGAFAKKAGVDAVLTGRLEKDFGTWNIQLELYFADPLRGPSLSRQATGITQPAMENAVRSFLRDADAACGPPAGN